MEVNNEPLLYQWILNEGLLRDEGTLFGIAGAAIQEKIDAIREYYRIRKAAFRTRQGQLEKKIEEINTHLSQTSSEILDLTDIGNPSNWLPVILQLLLYMGICFFNYWLESYWLSPVIHSTFICLGLYLFGLFCVFIGRSILYNPAKVLTDARGLAEPREKWKIYLEEFGVPLIVSLFISILPARSYPIENTIVAAFFFFMFFLLGGKGLVNTFFRARKELTLYAQYLRKKKDRRAKIKELNTLQDDLGAAVTALEELDGEEEYKIKVFTSEFKLAFESRQLTNGVSMKKLA